MNTQTKKILIVEDEISLASLYEEILTDEGYFVEVIHEGNKAFEKIKNNSYDLILLDIMLPKMDGLQILKMLTEEQKKSNGPIVIISNLDKKELIEEATKSGAIGYIVKSATRPDEIANMVSVYINQ